MRRVFIRRKREEKARAKVYSEDQAERLTTSSVKVTGSRHQAKSHRKTTRATRALYAYCDVWRFEGDKLAELRAFVIRPTIPE